MRGKMALQITQPIDFPYVVKILPGIAHVIHIRFLTQLHWKVPRNKDKTEQRNTHMMQENISSHLQHPEGA